MREFFIAIGLFMYLLPEAQSIKEIQDRIAIQNVVDTFSILADHKQMQKQVLLFTEDATVETILNGRSTGVLRGRRQIGDSFARFLSNFETVFHLNGQQTLTTNGEKVYSQKTGIG